ncbi:MAG: Holliday junction branch migration protein RuvA [Candidatus Brennerbacteria bacterium]|nr:Holliday junction branch migration protein RuvA [Candidatus Brennerbacteria bacterium]
MIRLLRGTLIEIQEHAAVVDCHGVGFAVLANRGTLAALPPKGSEVAFYTHFYLREERAELYGFLDSRALTLFELLKSVAGVGPKTALAVLDAETPENLTAAIFERRTDLLTKTPGIGRKTAERIVLELATKIAAPASQERTAAMDRDREVEEVLASLGYARDQVKQAISSLPPAKEATTEHRIRDALKTLARRPL